MGTGLSASGDFNGSGRAQLLLYDPSSGDAQFLTFNKNLSQANQVTQSSWGTNMVLYVGHFGTSALSVMLYDPQAGESTFIAFDASLQIAHQYTVKSWDQSWQVLVGAFMDRSRCITNGNCKNGDDILVLNRADGAVGAVCLLLWRSSSRSMITVSRHLCAMALSLMIILMRSIPQHST